MAQEPFLYHLGPERMQRDFYHLYLQTFISTVETKIKIKTDSQKCSHSSQILFAPIPLMQQTIKPSQAHLGKVFI